MLYSNRWPERKYAMHNDELLQLLGVTNGKLPKEGMPQREINGVQVYVLPAKPPRNGRKSSAHRIMAICPDCNRHMSAGRLASQHYRRMHGPKSILDLPKEKADCRVCGGAGFMSVEGGDCKCCNGTGKEER